MGGMVSGPGRGLFAPARRQGVEALPGFGPLPGAPSQGDHYPAEQLGVWVNFRIREKGGKAMTGIWIGLIGLAVPVLFFAGVYFYGRRGE